jgi:hypothetical protein
MLSQIRIYTINKGEMDAFLKHFKEEVMVVHERIGLPIVGTWVNRPQNEFIWIRNLKPRVRRFKRRSRRRGLSWERTSRKWKCAKSKRRSPRQRNPEPRWGGKTLRAVDFPQ